MSVTAHILKLLSDGGKGMEDAILVAESMQRGDDARRMFDLVKTIESQERTADDRADVVLIYAKALLAESRRGIGRPANNNSAEAGAKARWGYDGPVIPRLPDREWWPLRNYILERDNHVCRYCGDSHDRMCVDHVVPLSRGGTNHEDNLVACCLPCNSSKCDKLLDEWEGRYCA